MESDSKSVPVEEKSSTTLTDAENANPNVRLLRCKSKSASDGEAHVHIIGTLHVSKASCDEVRDLIQKVRPELVFLELCHDRLEALLTPTVNTQEIGWDKLLKTVRREKNAFAAIYAWFIAKVGAEVEVHPGEEFRVAFYEAQKCGAEVFLGDRPVQVTVLRTWARLSLWQRLKLLGSMLFMALWLPSKEELKAELEKMMAGDIISVLIAEVGRHYPSLIETLVTERDMYMSAMLRKVAESRSTVVAVVGKGHLEGIASNWERTDIDICRLLQRPTEKRRRTLTWKATGFVFVGTAFVGMAILIRSRVLRST